MKGVIIAMLVLAAGFIAASLLTEPIPPEHIAMAVLGVGLIGGAFASSVETDTTHLNSLKEEQSWDTSST